MKATSISVYSPVAFSALTVLAALDGGCAVEPASSEKQAPSDASWSDSTASQESLGRVEQAISQRCVGTTYTGGTQRVATCYELTGYQCLTTDRCAPCDIGMGCCGTGTVIINTPGSIPQSCSAFSLSDCLNHLGCSFDSPSPLSAGYYVLNGGTIIYANEAGLYCSLNSWAQCVVAGGKCTNKRKDITSVPASMTYAGQCKLPSGFFFSKDTGYYANGAGHYCAFTSWEQWRGAGGPRSGAPWFEPIPNSMIYDGICGSSSSNTSGGASSGGASSGGASSGGASSGGASSGGAGACTSTEIVASFCPTGTSSDEPIARDAYSRATAACQGCRVTSTSESGCVNYHCSL
jgi:uncharacterized membrane protein YgcG